MRNANTLFLSLLLLLSFQINAQVQQFISSNSLSAVETYAADICPGSDVSLIIVAPNTEEFDWTWYGPNNFYASGKTVYISSYGENMAGLYEAVTPNGEFYHFELMTQEEDFINFTYDRLVGNNGSIKINAPKKKAGYTYQWSNGETGSFIVASPSNTSTYSVTVTTEFGCSDSDALIIYVPEDETRVITDYRMVCDNQIYYIEGPTGYSSYEWLRSGETSKDIIYRVRNNMWFWLKATDNRGEVYFYKYRLKPQDCSPKKSNYVIETPNDLDLDDEVSFEQLTGDEPNIVELSEIAKQQAVKRSISTSIFPNPVSEILNVNLDIQKGLVENTVVVLNNSNKKVLEFKNDKSSFKIDLQEFEGGVYNLMIENKNGISTQQFVVIK